MLAFSFTQCVYETFLRKERTPYFRKAVFHESVHIKRERPGQQGL